MNLCINFYFSDLRQEDFMDQPGTFKYNYGWEYDYRLAGSSFDVIKDNRILNRAISSLQYRVSAREVDQFKVVFHQIRKIHQNSLTFCPYRRGLTCYLSAIAMILLKFLKSFRGFIITPIYSIDEDLYQELGFRIEKNGSHFYSVDVIRCLKALFEEIHGTTVFFRYNTYFIRNIFEILIHSL